MYVPKEVRDDLAGDLAKLLHEEKILIAFAKMSAELYEDYDEYTADDIIRRMKKIFIKKYVKKKKEIIQTKQKTPLI